MFEFRFRFVSLILAVLSLLSLPVSAVAQTAHFSGGESIVADMSTAPMYLAWGIAIDSSGNVYIADKGSAEVLKETPTAGGFSGSVVAKTAAYDVAVDASGNVYVATGVEVLKETPTAGGYTESVVASGTSGLAPIGVAVDASGNVYIANENNPVLKETYANGSYTQSALPFTSGGSRGYIGVVIAIDSNNNLYIFNSALNKVLKETPSGSGYSESTVASGPGQFMALWVDASGNVYIAEDNYPSPSLVLKETPGSGGSYTESTISVPNIVVPEGVAADSFGNVYVSGTNNAGWPAVLKLSSSVNFGTVALGVSSTNVGYSVLTLTFVFDSGGTLGSTVVLTQGASSLDFIDAGTGSCTAGTQYSAGQSCTIIASFNPTAIGLREGAAVLKDSGGNVFATAYLSGIGTAPEVGFLPGTQSTPASGFKDPVGVAIDGSKNIIVTDAGNSAVKLITAASGYSAVNKLGGSFTGFKTPNGVAVDGVGNIFVGDTSAGELYELLAPNYTTVNTVGSGMAPAGVAVDGSGNLFVADYGNSAVKEILAEGGYGTVNTLATIDHPNGIAVDGSGNVYVTSAAKSEVYEIEAVNGSIPASPTITPLGSGFSNPNGVTGRSMAAFRPPIPPSTRWAAASIGRQQWCWMGAEIFTSWITRTIAWRS